MRTRGERVLVVDGDETLARVNWRRVRQLVLIGRVGMSTPFLHHALDRGVEVILLDDAGGYLGRVQPGERGREFDKRLQYEAAATPGDCLRLARAFVLGKLQNQRVMLQRLDRKMAEPSWARPSATSTAYAPTPPTQGRWWSCAGWRGGGQGLHFGAVSDFLAPGGDGRDA